MLGEPRHLAQLSGFEDCFGSSRFRRRRQLANWGGQIVGRTFGQVEKNRSIAEPRQACDAIWLPGISGSAMSNRANKDRPLEN